MSKIWIIGDTHFGVRNNSKRWEELMSSWMHDFFFPLIDKESEEGDVLVHLGDVFDNRQSVGLSTMALTISFFEKLSSRFEEIWVLCGNHDAYYTSKNDISSIECIKHIENVNIVKTPIFHPFLCNKKVLFMPWTENSEAFNKKIYDVNPDIVFCHAEFNGCVMNSSMTFSENNFNIPNISHIYSGHIHHRQKHKNVTYVGSPYQLTQNDRNNHKGVYTYDTEKDIEKFYQNNTSPEFIRIKYDDIKDKPLQEFKKICENKFVEVETDYSLMAKCRFQKLLSLIKEEDNIMDLTFVPSKTSKNEEKDINISDCISISEMLDKYIDEFVYCDELTKKSVKIISKKLVNG